MSKKQEKVVEDEIRVAMERLVSNALDYGREQVAATSASLGLQRLLTHVQDELIPKTEDEIRNYCLDVGIRDADFISGQLTNTFSMALPSVWMSMRNTFARHTPVPPHMALAGWSAWVKGYVAGIPARTRVAVETR